MIVYVIYSMICSVALPLLVAQLLHKKLKKGEGANEVNSEVEGSSD